MDKAKETVGASALSPSRAVAIMRRLAGPIWLRVGMSAVLTVPGRKTGLPLRVMLIPVKLNNAIYLLSFGGVTEWARNLRSAGLGELRFGSRTQVYTAVEVDGDERDLVIAKYLAGSGPLRRDFYRRPDPGDHPTFKMVP